MFLLTWSYDGAVLVLLAAGNWPDEDGFSSCSLHVKTGVTGACLTVSFLELFTKVPGFESSVPCLAFLLVEIASLLSTVLSTGHVFTFFGILNFTGRRDVKKHISSWEHDEFLVLCDTDVAFPGIEVTFFHTFELLSEVVHLAEVEDFCSVETKLGLISCFFNLDGLLREDFSFELPVEVRSCLWGTVLALSMLKDLDGLPCTVSLPGLSRFALPEQLSPQKGTEICFDFECSPPLLTGFWSVACDVGSL